MTLRDKAWSPYAAGILIGLLQIPAFLLIQTALGTSSSYVTIAAHIAALFDASVANMDYLAKHMYGAKNLWQAAMVAGIAIGTLVSATISATRRSAISPVWRRAAGIDRLSSRAPMAFAGGFIMVLGARIADGCTTGHGISGIAQLAVGSTVAVAAMFVGGIVTALLMRRV
ncbi:MAG TPA: YeeE/YedE thiosulfate transporter family protein [Hyphomicrobiaceae bacterium]|nr:YeeE/YedE thiosulfate transporter family protein [Hyphomicrobiaceae bacterium]